MSLQISIITHFVVVRTGPWLRGVEFAHGSGSESIRRQRPLAGNPFDSAADGESEASHLLVHVGRTESSGDIRLQAAIE